MVRHVVGVNKCIKIEDENFTELLITSSLIKIISFTRSDKKISGTVFLIEKLLIVSK